MKDKIKNIIIDSYNKALRERKEFYLNGAIFQVINPITHAINLENVVAFLKKKIPNQVLDLIDVYYIGNFDFLNQRETNAAYMDGAIYLSNDQDNEKDLLDDIYPNKDIESLYQLLLIVGLYSLIVSFFTSNPLNRIRLK